MPLFIVRLYSLSKKVLFRQGTFAAYNMNYFM